MLLASAIIESTWIAQTWCVGKPRTAIAGWWFGISNMALWFAFGLATGGYFFSACAVLGAVLYVRNLKLARASQRREAWLAWTEKML